MTELAEAAEIDPQLVEVMYKVQEGIFGVCLFYNADFRELVDDQELTHGVSSALWV